MNPALRERTLFLSRVPAGAGGEKPDRIASPSPLPGTVQLPAALAQVKWPQPRLGQLGSPPSPDPSPGPLGMATPATTHSRQVRHGRYLAVVSKEPKSHGNPHMTHP